MTRAKANTLKRRFASYRVCRFDGGGTIIEAASVSKKDARKAAELLEGEATLWPPGACNGGMTMWIQFRTWYPIMEKNAE